MMFQTKPKKISTNFPKRNEHKERYTPVQKLQVVNPTMMNNLDKQNFKDELRDPVLRELLNEKKKITKIRHKFKSL